VTAAFKYDALGRRTERTVNGNTIGYLYDGSQAMAELRSNAIDTVYHTGLAIDEVLARYGSSGKKTLLTDALMSVIAQANDDQSVANFYAYSAYGQAITLGPDGGNSLQYTGRENDGTGLYYYRARYYDSVTKQWLSEDPIGLAGGLNLYAYVNGDPISFSDPEGLLGRGAGGGGPSPPGISPRAKIKLPGAVDRPIPPPPPDPATREENFVGRIILWCTRRSATLFILSPSVIGCDNEFEQCGDLPPRNRRRTLQPSGPRG